MDPGSRCSDPGSKLLGSRIQIACIPDPKCLDPGSIERIRFLDPSGSEVEIRGSGDRIRGSGWLDPLDPTFRFGSAAKKCVQTYKLNDLNHKHCASIIILQGSLLCFAPNRLSESVASARQVLFPGAPRVGSGRIHVVSVVLKTFEISVGLLAHRSGIFPRAACSEYHQTQYFLENDGWI